ncbi:portal protein [Gordonia phage Soos]|nr:portal protein [Gordonia phage Soos]
MTKIANRPEPDWSPGMKTTHRTGRSLIAAAGPVQIGSPSGSVTAGGTSSTESEAWQNDAWTFFNCVGELRYICSWLTNALSRCTLVPSDINPETGQPTGETEDQMVAETIADIAGGPAGQSQLLGRLATFLTVPGEGYIAIIVREGQEEWHVLSKEEVTKKSGGGDIEIVLDDGEKYVLNDDTDTLARVYRPHPRNAQFADSPIRASLPTLREMVRLGQWVEATAKSRLAGNGIFVVPNEMSLPKSGAPQGDHPQTDPDAPGLPPVTPSEFPTDNIMYDQSAGPSEVMQALIDAGSTAIQQPDTAAALLPLVMQGPGEWLDKMQHITFSTEFTEVVIKLREAATRRLALTVDVPAEILLGTGDMNHWSAWQVEESAIKLHVEPLLTLICDAITEHILRPLLELKGHPDPQSVMVWYSTTGLTMRPNRSADAKDAYDRRIIDGDTYRKELGYDDTNAIKVPKTDDERFALALQLMEKDSRYAKIVGDLAGIELPDPPPSFNPAETSAPQDESDPEQKDKVAPIPDTKEDAEDGAAAASIRTALIASVVRRVEVAGKRMRTRGNLSTLAGVAAADTYRVLPTVNHEKAMKLCDADSSYDRALCGPLGSIDVDKFSTFAHLYAAELIENRRPLTHLQHLKVPPALLNVQPLKRVK